MQSNLLMSGKRGVVMGVINKWSIAWGIAKALDEAGAEIAFTTMDGAISEKVKSLCTELQNEHKFYECNVKKDESISECFDAIERDVGKIDFLVHSIAFADKNFLKGKYSAVTREAFCESMDVSCYSFTACAARAEQIMNDNGSMLTLSYYGAEKYVTNYNVMGVAKAALEASVKYLAYDFGERGIRVNSISAGPVKTISAKGISDMDQLTDWCKTMGPIKKTASIEEIGQSALYLISNMSSGVTGEILHVDCGYNVCGVPKKDSIQSIVKMNSDLQ